MRIEVLMKRMCVFAAFLFTFLGSHKAIAQAIAPQDMERLHIMEDSMVVTVDSMYDAFIPDTRIGFAERLVRQLIRILKIQNSWEYSFDTLKKVINIIYSDDSAFRMFNWEVTPSNITKRYYGAIQLPGPQLKLIGLNDYSEELGKGLEDSVLSNRRWFGAIYYRIMGHDVQGQRVYTLFGFNGTNSLSNKKVLDPMTFNGNGVTFGAPIFALGSKNFPGRGINRFVLEYKKDVQVSMNWDPERNVIIFDKLVSQINDPNRKYTFAPTGQYDGLRWENERWNYVSDLIPVTILKDGEAPEDPPVSPKFQEK